jgi:catechol 2,3-dioxygenase-like lactoylglutathione lyase family enzyme
LQRSPGHAIAGCAAPNERLSSLVSIQRTYLNVLVADLAAARRFYVDFLGFKVGFSSDWFVLVAAPDNERLEVGLLRRDHEVVPEADRDTPRGGMLTIIVDDVDAMFETAQARGPEVVEPPRDLFYGQRRMLLRDPDGLLVDVSSPCDPDPAWEAHVRGIGDGAYVED